MEDIKPEVAPTKNLTFGVALQKLKGGIKVARSGWNGKGMWAKLINVGDYQVVGSVLTSPEIDTIRPWLGLRAADGSFGSWNPNNMDILAEDWEIID